MKLLTVEKSKDYIFSHMYEDVHFIRIERTPSRTSSDGKTLSEYTSFRTKTLRKMSLEEIDEAVADENTVLIKIEM